MAGDPTADLQRCGSYCRFAKVSSPRIFLSPRGLPPYVPLGFASAAIDIQKFRQRNMFSSSTALGESFDFQLALLAACRGPYDRLQRCGKSSSRKFEKIA